LVLPIGGLKEKLLAAHRAGIKTVLIPIENKKDLVEVPKTILESMEIIPVKNVDEVLKVALVKPLKRVEWVEVDQIAKKDKTKKELSTH
jgi:ATP-dependent Lon protease